MVFGTRQSKWGNKCTAVVPREQGTVLSVGKFSAQPKGDPGAPQPKGAHQSWPQENAPLSRAWGPSSIIIIIHHQHHLRDSAVTLITMRGKNQTNQTVGSTTEPMSSEEIQPLHSYLSWESQAFAVTPPCWNDSHHSCFLSCLLLSPEEAENDQALLWSPVYVKTEISKLKNWAPWVWQQIQLQPMEFSSQSWE